MDRPPPATAQAHGGPSPAARHPHRHALPLPNRRPVGEAPSFGIMWHVMRSIGDAALPTFFSSLAIDGLDHLPPSSHPLILCSTHHNTILDVAILASHMPDRRPLHFWAKSGLFVNPISGAILTSSGNISVDRRHRNNHALFQGTFHALNRGGAVALFPEGGSYSNPALTKLKAGAAWAALEYTQHLRIHAAADDKPAPAQPTAALGRAVTVLPAAIVYSDKSRFRSKAVLRFGKPIPLDDYLDEFLLSPPNAADFGRSTPGASGTSTPNTTDPSSERTPAHRAVARLTARLQAAIEQLSFNAPDWESYQAVRAARELIWDPAHPSSFGDEGELDMHRFVDVSNALLALLSLDRKAEATSTADGALASASQDARRALFAYTCLLRLCDTESEVLSHVMRRHGPVAQPGQLPSRSAALRGLASAVKSALVRLPYLLPTFVPTLLPTYLLPSWIANHFAKKEEESLASVKTLVGFGFSLLFYAYGLVRMLRFTRWNPSGLFLGAAAVWWMVELNRSCVDTAYSLVKQCRLAWGVWRAAAGRAAEPRSGGNATATATGKETGKTTQSTTSLFFYGTLVHPKILSRVIGNDGSHLVIQNGVLPAHALCHIRSQEYPGLVTQEELSRVFMADEARRLVDEGRVSVKGTLVSGLTPADVRCLDDFEDDEYTRQEVSIVLDPSAAACSNATRLQRGDGELNLERILAPLSPGRIGELLAAASEGKASRAPAQVYKWTAPLAMLEDRVWEFDLFAREKASRWVGERWEDGVPAASSSSSPWPSRAESDKEESDYELVDAVRLDGGLAGSSSSSSSGAPSPSGGATRPRATPFPVPVPVPASVPGTATGINDHLTTPPWHRSYVSNLTSHKPTQDTLLLTLHQLSHKPSIQHWVNEAFRRPPIVIAADRSKKFHRPARLDAHLLGALYAARVRASEAVERLFDAVPSEWIVEEDEEGEEEEKVKKALRVVWNAKRVEGGRRGREDGKGWPFGKDK